MKRVAYLWVMLFLCITAVIGCWNSGNSTDGSLSGRNNKMLEEKIAALIKQAVQSNYGEYDTVIEVNAIQYARSEGKNYTGSAEVVMRNNETIEMYKLAITFNMINDGDRTTLELGKAR